MSCFLYVSDIIEIHRYHNHHRHHYHHRHRYRHHRYRQQQQQQQQQQQRQRQKEKQQQQQQQQLRQYRHRRYRLSHGRSSSVCPDRAIVFEKTIVSRGIVELVYKLRKTLPTEKFIHTTCSRSSDAGTFGGKGGGGGGGGGGEGGGGGRRRRRRRRRDGGGGAEGCSGGGGGTRGRGVLGPAEKFEAVKVASSLGLQGPSAPIGAQLLATGGSEDAPAATVYHANLVAGSNTSVVTAALQQPVLASLNSVALASMQASAEANSLDIQAMQSMDWLFKKERIYLLAQFWQQVS
uniref:Uncharacterized protein n=1 Tax=Vespula pensylvanica TaxID=30213 RepID=A0A834N0I6_VESPE|nr:hypothetical protein H0235_017691 [Vespula pensylvanica]